MKKILLLIVIIASTGTIYQSYGQAQLCGAGSIRHWTGVGDPGDMGVSPAGSGALPINLFQIDGSSTNDWDHWISGTFLYSGGPKGGFEPTPYGTPVAGANIQIDGLKSGTIANGTYDRDAVGQDHRDLRYFAFTYDRANVYFFFRRPQNNTAQVSLYYFIDINVDGWMANGEPVIHVTFNNSGSSIEMGYYEAALPNGFPASSYDAVKGNIMSAPVARAKTNNTSEWAVGSADGWSMPGNFKNFNSGVQHPALGSVGSVAELFNSQTLTDTHVDGDDAGYGVEFVVPWSYFRMYNAQGSNGSGLTFENIFTWHVSLVSGQSGISGAEDNAGGCCSGVAVSGAPNISKAASWEKLADQYNYRLTTTFTNGKIYQTKVTVPSFKVINPRDGLGAPIPQEVVSNWTATGYRTNASGCNGNDAQVEPVAFTYNGRSIVPNSIIPGKNDTIFTFVSSDLSKSNTTISGSIGAVACYFINVNAFGWPPLASATITYQFSSAFDISSNTCDDLQEGAASEGVLEVLPVKLVYFNAARSGANVNLTWQTSIEENSKGFDVQRFTGGVGGWQTIAFVPSQAVNGRSNSPLNYQFTDFNNTTKGITQYRLKQLDNDNRSSYSLIRSVRGDGQKGKTIVYPNPSSDGKVSIIFEDVNGTRDISVADVSGRVIKQMKGVTNNNITIDNLSAGFYTVRIVNNETGEQTVEKFVVNKR
jgi:Secretion system C-terminal sorting domain